MNTQEIRNDIKPYKYEIEVGHSKSGSAHVVIIKSLKVRGDDLPYALSEQQADLREFKLNEDEE